MTTQSYDNLPIAVTTVRALRDESRSIVDLEWVSSNSAFSSTLGYTPEDIVGKKLTDMRHFFFEDDTAFIDGVSHCIDNQKQLQMFTEAREEGRPLAGAVHMITMVPLGETATVISQDVSEIATENRKVGENFRLFRQAALEALLGNIICDPSGEILFANDAFMKLLGHENDNIIGQNIADFVDDEDREFHLAETGKLNLESGRGFTSQTRYRSKTGESIPCSATVTIFEDKISHETYYVSQISDIREELKTKQELESALTRAKDSTRMKSEFLANMSHEIRTPLNGVIGMAQVISHSKLNDEQRESIDTILDSGKSLMSLLNDILDLSKIEAGKLDINPVATDIRHKLSRITQLFEPIAKEKKLELKLFVDPSVPSQLTFDPVRIRQCISNLVSNAIKFTSHGAVMVFIMARPLANGQYMIQAYVTDTGIGIDPDKADQIFDTFRQADGSTTRRFGGTGLGLSVTRSLARMMGGDVTVKSELDKGSVFILSFLAAEVGSELVLDGSTNISELHQALPQVTTNVPAAQSQKKPASAKVEPLKHESLRILVVDDNKINRHVIVSFLKLHNMTSVTATNGEEALQTLEKEQAFDLILMDIHMPILDGLGTLRRIRASDDPWVDIPVIALTADAMTGDREQYIREGMTGYVAKPIDEQDLISEINRVMSNHTPVAAAG